MTEKEAPSQWPARRCRDGGRVHGSTKSRRGHRKSGATAGVKSIVAGRDALGAFVLLVVRRCCHVRECQAAPALDRGRAYHDPRNSGHIPWREAAAPPALGASLDTKRQDQLLRAIARRAHFAIQPFPLTE